MTTHGRTSLADLQPRDSRAAVSRAVARRRAFGPRAGGAAAARARAGFTLMELTMGMMITGLVMAATAGLMTAVGQGWQQSESADSNASAASQVHLRLQRILKGARQIGYYRAGSISGAAGFNAAVLFWKDDVNQDGKLQNAELAVIGFQDGGDPQDAQTLRLYQIVKSSVQPDVNAEVDPTDYYKKLYDGAFFTQFMGRPDVAYTVISAGVTAAEFYKSDASTTVRPEFHYVLKLRRGGGTETEYGTAAERVATTLPVSQR